MRTKSGILADIVRAAQSNNQGTILERGELEPEIPGVIQPVIQIPHVLMQVAGFNTNQAQLRSWFRQTARTKGASAAANDDRIGTLGAGLWAIEYDCHFHTTYTETALGDVMSVELIDSAGSGFPFCELSAITSDVGRTGRLLIHVIESGWYINLHTPSTGAGEAQRAGAFINAVKHF